MGDTSGKSKIWKRGANIYHYHPHPTFPPSCTQESGGEGEKGWEGGRATEWMLSLTYQISYKPSNTVVQTSNYQQQEYTRKGLTHLPKYLRSQVGMGWRRQRQQLRILVRSLLLLALLTLSLLLALRYCIISAGFLNLCPYNCKYHPFIKFSPNPICVICYLQRPWDKNIIVYRLLSQSHLEYWKQIEALSSRKRSK